MRESAKALKRLENDYLWRRVRRQPGPVLDIGCGVCPIPDATPWDKPQGDAQALASVRQGMYGLVFSSHCLEHLEDWRAALHRWMHVTRPGGFVWVLVPDFHLYEHGHWPSRYNAEHRHYFIAGRLAADLGRMFPPASLLRVQVVDTGYDYGAEECDQTLGGAEAAIEFVLQRPWQP